MKTVKKKNNQDDKHWDDENDFRISISRRKKFAVSYPKKKSEKKAMRDTEKSHQS
jgi:hypothetical protein